jgi:hypothetical protein
MRAVDLKIMITADTRYAGAALTELRRAIAFEELMNRLRAVTGHPDYVIHAAIVLWGGDPEALYQRVLAGSLTIDARGEVHKGPLPLLLNGGRYPTPEDGS